MKKSVYTVALLTVLLPLNPAWSRHKKDNAGAAPATTQTTPASDAQAQADAVKNQPPITIKVNGTDVQVPAGTIIHLELEDYLSGNKAKAGQEVHYLTTEDVLGPNQQVVIQKGAPALGKVLSRSGAGGLTNKGSKLTFDAEWVNAVDGTRVPLIFTKELKTKGGAAKTILFGNGKGKNVKAKKGWLMDAVIGATAPQTAAAATGTASSPTQDKAGTAPEQAVKQ